MPYHSEAQRRWAHTLTGKRALGGNAAVHEWDKASKGKSLPEKVKEAAAAAGVVDAVGAFGGLKAKTPPTVTGSIPKLPTPTPSALTSNQNSLNTFNMDGARSNAHGEVSLAKPQPQST